MLGFLRLRPKAHASDSALSRLWVDAVEKVPNGFAANFPPKDEKRDDCSIDPNRTLASLRQPRSAADRLSRGRAVHALAHIGVGDGAKFGPEGEGKGRRGTVGQILVCYVDMLH